MKGESARSFAATASEENPVHHKITPHNQKILHERLKAHWWDKHHMHDTMYRKPHIFGGINAIMPEITPPPPPGWNGDASSHHPGHEPDYHSRNPFFPGKPFNLGNYTFPRSAYQLKDNVIRFPSKYNDELESPVKEFYAHAYATTTSTTTEKPKPQQHSSSHSHTVTSKPNTAGKTPVHHITTTHASHPRNIARNQARHLQKSNNIFKHQQYYDQRPEKLSNTLNHSRSELNDLRHVPGITTKQQATKYLNSGPHAQDERLPGHDIPDRYKLHSGSWIDTHNEYDILKLHDQGVGGDMGQGPLGSAHSFQLSDPRVAPIRTMKSSRGFNDPIGNITDWYLPSLPMLGGNREAWTGNA